MIERTLFVLMVALLGYAAYRWYLRRQMRTAADSVITDPLIANGKPGVPTIVYFTTPTCAPCRLQQTPVLNQLRREMDEDHLRLIRIDATEDPAAAERWGVFSVPTLFIIDQASRLRNVHNGVVGLEQLKQELQQSKT